MIDPQLTFPIIFLSDVNVSSLDTKNWCNFGVRVFQKTYFTLGSQDETVSL